MIFITTFYFDDLNFEQIANNTDIVDKYADEWNVDEYFVMIYWEYGSTDEE